MSTVFNPISTSGIGFRLEHYVQASYTLSLLLGIPVPFENGLTIKELNFQAKMVANADDLIIHFSDSSKYFIQSKKGFEINSNKTFEEVIEFLWKDFNKTDFEKEKYKFLITTDRLNNTDAEHGILVLEWARFSSSYKDFYTKIKDNKQVQSKYKYFLAAIKKTGGETVEEDLIFDFLRTIYLKAYDYLEIGSKDAEVLKWFIKPFLRAGSTGESALLKVLDYVETCNQHGATLTRSNIDISIKDLFDLSESPLISSELTELIKKSNSQLSHTVFNTIDDLHIDRTALVLKMQELLSSHELIVINGEGGIGKSGLAKDFLIKAYPNESNYLFFKADQLDESSLAKALSNIGIHSDFETILSQWLLLPRLIIYIDGFEKLYESENKEAFLELLGKLKQANNIKLLITCRRYAFETLRRKYSINKNDVGEIELFPLSEEQLEEVRKHKPVLEKVFANPNLRRLMKIPFYIKAALQAIDLIGSVSELNEHEFKQELWNVIVEKKGAVKVGVSKKRSKEFSTIVINRAKAKLPYIKPDNNADIAIVEDLENEGLLIKQPKFDSYTPAHDIFEDLVIVKHLNELFQVKENSIQFLQSIDTNPVFRRGLRLWIQELIIDQSDESKLFLAEVLPLYTSYTIVDEILIGILGSDQVYDLVAYNIRTFLENNSQLFRRAIQLLKLAYTEPYKGDLPQRRIKAIGQGWNAFVRLMDEYYLANSISFNLLRVDLIYHWSLQYDPDESIPIEGEIVAKHCLQFLQEWKESYPLYSPKDVYEILFLVSAYAVGEIDTLLQDIVESNKPNPIIGIVEKVTRNEELCKMLLVETFRCVNVYKVCPKPIIELAKLKWYNSKPLREYDTDYKEKSFGFKSYPYNYFSASGYQTPFRCLFKYHASLALEFLFEVCDRSLSLYLKSDYAKQNQTEKFPLSISGHKEIEIYGNDDLWIAYRGHGSAPYILQSILMAFENYLLDEAASDKLTEGQFDSILERSNSVLLISILFSVNTAYPWVYKDRIFTLLQRREFFAWDLSRYAMEWGTQHTTIGNEPYYTKERHNSNQLPHRKKNLEQLISLLQLYYPQQANELIDCHKSKADKEDHLWLLALTRMDIRNTIPEIREEEGVLVLNPKPLSDDLQQFVDKDEPERKNHSSSISIFLWADRVLSNKEEISYQEWKNNRNTLVILNSDSFTNLLSAEKKIAAIGIKHFANELSREEAEYCVRVLLETLKETLTNLKLGHSFYAIDAINKEIFTVVPILFRDIFKEFVLRSELISMFTDLLILLPHETKSHLILGIRQYGWSTDIEVAQICFQILLKSSKDTQLYRRIYRLTELPPDQLAKEIDRLLEPIKVQPDIQAEEIILDDVNFPQITEALELIPFELLNTDYYAHLIRITELISSLEDWEDSTHSTFLERFQMLLANYFNHNSDKNSTGFLLKLLHHKTVPFKFTMGVLNWFVWLGHDMKYPAQFWFHIEVIDKYIGDVAPTIGFIRVVMLYPLKESSVYNLVPEQSGGRKLHEFYISHFANNEDMFEEAFKLLTSSGSSYQPLCLTWLQKSLPDKKSYDVRFKKHESIGYIEKFVQQLYEKHIDHLYKNRQHLDYFIMLLDILINTGSTQAFRMRDELI